MFKQTLIASALLAAAVGAQAQSTLGVTGTISPNTCTVTLGGGGVMAYGTLNTTTVKSYSVSTGHYLMLPKTFTYTISCSGPITAELAFTDNQAGKNTAMDANDVTRFGVVDGTGTTAIGAYSMTTLSDGTPQIDGAGVFGYYMAPNGTTTWSALTPGGGMQAGNLAPGYALGWTKAAGQTVPQQLTTASGTIRTSLYLSKPYVDAATTAITLNAGGTITLQYL